MIFVCKGRSLRFAWEKMFAEGHDTNMHGHGFKETERKRLCLFVRVVSYTSHAKLLRAYDCIGIPKNNSIFSLPISIDHSFYWKSGSSSVIKFLAFYRTRIFMTMFTKAWYLSVSWKKINPIHTLSSYWFKIHFNIIHSCWPKSPKFSLCFGFPQQCHLSYFHPPPPLTPHMPSLRISSLDSHYFYGFLFIMLSGLWHCRP